MSHRQYAEILLPEGAEPNIIYDQLNPNIRHHHFWDEPWNPKAFSVRVRIDQLPEFNNILNNIRPRGSRFGDYDGSDDAKMFGKAWPAVEAFFDATSQLRAVAPRDNDKLNEFWAMKLVHCFLNAQRYDPIDEFKWALKFARRRLFLSFQFRLYAKSRKTYRLLFGRFDWPKP